ncbi:PEP-CTERM sorting domain-containing protein, partial [Candidatus Auribacterota bacterium]
SGSSDMDYSYYKWAQNQGAYDSDWAISVDVAVPNWTMSSNEIVGVGFGITNSADPINDSFVIELEQGNHGSGSETSFTLDKMTDGNPGDEFDKTASALSGTVQIQYSSSDNKLYGFYNEGSGWNAMNPGGTGISDWGTVTAFNAFIVGTSENKSVDSGDGFTVDHFDAGADMVAAAPEPSTYALFGIGLFGLIGGWIRKKIKK